MGEELEAFDDGDWQDCDVIFVILLVLVLIRK